MVGAIDSGSSSHGSSVVFLGKTLLSYCLSSPRCINRYMGSLMPGGIKPCDGLKSHSERGGGGGGVVGPYAKERGRRPAAPIALYAEFHYTHMHLSFTAPR